MPDESLGALVLPFAFGERPLFRSLSETAFLGNPDPNMVSFLFLEDQAAFPLYVGQIVARGEAGYEI